MSDVSALVCPSCTETNFEDIMTTLHPRVECKSCGYSFCRLCSSACGVNHFIDDHLGDKKPSILKKRGIETHTDIPYMKTAALLNLAARTPLTLCSDKVPQFSKELLAILRPDRLLFYMATKNDAEMSDLPEFLWRLCKLAIADNVMGNHSDIDIEYCTILRELDLILEDCNSMKELKKLCNVAHFNDIFTAESVKSIVYAVSTEALECIDVFGKRENRREDV